MTHTEQINKINAMAEGHHNDIAKKIIAIDDYKTQLNNENCKARKCDDYCDNNYCPECPIFVEMTHASNAIDALVAKACK